MKKVSDEIIIESYNRLKNVWKVAKEVGLCGQSVHERTIKLGIQDKKNVFTDEDIVFLKENYTHYIMKGKLQELADKMGRTKQFICRKAKTLGLTDISRKRSIIEGYKKPIRTWANKEHPRGMKGKKHSQETLQKLSIISKERNLNMTDEQKSEKVFKMLKTKKEKGNFCPERNKTTWKSGWREIGGYRKYFRSRWEANYARYLEFLKKNNQIKEWIHEPDVFWFDKIKRGCVSYLPDFKVINNNDSIEYHEVKGWMDDRSKTKIKRMSIYYPDIKLIIINSDWFKNNKQIVPLIKDWE